MSVNQTYHLDISLQLDEALDWVIRNLEEFNPFNKNRAWKTKNAQRVSELAILLICLKTFYPSKKKQIQKIFNILCSIQDNKRYRDRVLRMPEEFVLYCDLYAILARMGHDDLELRDVILKAVNQNLLSQTERLPHRIMDVSLSLELAGIQIDWPMLEEIYSETLLANDPNPFYLREGPIYAITHVLMFLFGFGLRDVDTSLFSSEIQKWKYILRVLLIDLTILKHWDIVSELLICWDCLNLPHEYIYNLAWEAIINKQLISGAFPGPESDIFDRENFPASQKAAQDQLFSFEHCYHTTLTTLIAGLLHSNRKNTSQYLLNSANNDENPHRYLKNHNKIKIQALEKAYTYLTNDIEELSSNGKWKPLQSAYDLVGIWIVESALGNKTHIKNSIDKVYNLSKDNQQIIISSSDLDYQDLSVLTLAGLLTTGYKRNIPEFKEITSSVIFSLHNKILQTPGMLSIENILSNLNLHQASPKISSNEVNNVFNKSNFLQSKKDILQFISYADHFGHKEEKQIDMTEKFVGVLQGIVSNYFREYQLVDGMYALRCLNHLIPADNKTIELASNFLCTHQQSSGAFGYLGPELDLCNILDKDKSFSSGMDFSNNYFLIKVTQAAIWTIAETLNSGWALTQAFTDWCHSTN